jgi:hypothetical protein
MRWHVEGTNMLLDSHAVERIMGIGEHGESPAGSQAKPPRSLERIRFERGNILYIAIAGPQRIMPSTS